MQYIFRNFDQISYAAGRLEGSQQLRMHGCNNGVRLIAGTSHFPLGARNSGDTFLFRARRPDLIKTYKRTHT